MERNKNTSIWLDSSAWGKDQVDPKLNMTQQCDVC